MLLRGKPNYFWISNEKLNNHNNQESGLAASLCLGVAANAHAGLVGVKTIEIKNHIYLATQYLQVAEVAAVNTAGTNVALASNGGTASAPDFWSSTSSASKAIDGSTAGSYPNIFHEGQNNTHDTLTITLASVQELLSFQIWGRTDCCSNRDLLMSPSKMDWVTSFSSPKTWTLAASPTLLQCDCRTLFQNRLPSPCLAPDCLALPACVAAPANAKSNFLIKAVEKSTAFLCLQILSNQRSVLAPPEHPAASDTDGSNA